jgi:hypothetical protein
VPAEALARDSTAWATKRRTGNYCSHTLLVCQENQGSWLLSYDYVAHTWLTGSEEYVVFIPRED